MPVYLRKNAAMTPPAASESEVPDDDQEDFIQDPDQFRDRLPQPFRMLDKVVNKIVDDAWVIISSREEVRVAEASRIRPPQYECDVQLQEHEGACCMCSTPDGQYVVVGLPNGLVALDAHTGQTSATWDEAGMEITTVQSSTLAPDTYMISTVDDMGLARLFALAGGNFILIANLNEQDGGSKMVAAKCEASKEGTYVGLLLENTKSKESWLEIHKTAKDAWLKDLESIVSKSQSETKVQQGSAQQAKPTSPSPESEANVESSDPSGHPTTDEGVNPQESESRSQSPGSQKDQTNPGQSNEKISHKFTPTNVILKVKPPAPIQGITWSSPLQLAKTIDQGDVIGTGNHHQVSVPHLEQRLSMFEALHQKYIKYLPKEEKPVQRQASFHFLQPGRLLPHGMDNAAFHGQPTSVAIWWSDHSQLMFYSLIKQAKAKSDVMLTSEDKTGTKAKKTGSSPGDVSKDLEHKPEIVWPHSDAVTMTTVSADSSLLAVALKNGTLVTWDLYLGVSRRIIHITDESPIVKIQFLDPCICPQDNNNYPPYGTKTNAYVLVWCKDGQLYLVNTGLGCQDPMEEISAGFEKDDEKFTLVEPIPGIPEVLLTCRQNGSIFLHNILTGSILCEVILPKTHSLTSPWQPVIALGAKGEMLFVKGSQKPEETSTEGEEEEEEKAATDFLFSYPVHSCPALDQYSRKEETELSYITHTTVDKRVDALLRERICQQGLRKVRMQERWDQMRLDLELIQKARDGNKHRSHTAFSLSTMEKSILQEEASIGKHM